MSFDVQQLLRRQAHWQKSRQALSWPEKIRMAERIRESIQTLRSVSAQDAPEKGRPHPPTIVASVRRGGDDSDDARAGEHDCR